MRLYLPANVRSSLLTYKDKLIVQQPDKAGTLDIHGNDLAKRLCSNAPVN
ncbi:MAG: hypothetical protein M1133_03470 [Armatimonadetes bacterium]|nr:hypothetical protein [Armatimonadota bacterium]